MWMPLEYVLSNLCVFLATLVLSIESLIWQKLTAILNTFWVIVISILVRALSMVVHSQCDLGNNYGNVIRICFSLSLCTSSTSGPKNWKVFFTKIDNNAQYIYCYCHLYTTWCFVNAGTLSNVIQWTNTGMQL